MPTIDTLAAFWTAPMLKTNILVFFNLLGALLLGLLVGYERAYHGRAAGMRTYGLVCMASAALTVIGGFSSAWFGGNFLLGTATDTSRVIQGIVTGIGFLGAGVIMREGFNISGLTTAASIWASAAIGVLVGIGFYAAAILLTAVSVLCMTFVSKLEAWLPNRQALLVVLRFRPGFQPRQDVLARVAAERGYEIATGTLTIDFQNQRPEWRFVAVALSRESGTSLSDLAAELTRFDGVEDFHLSRARN